MPSIESLKGIPQGIPHFFDKQHLPAVPELLKSPKELLILTAAAWVGISIGQRLQPLVLPALSNFIEQASAVLGK